jgi:ubiquinol-cytochrome c reductase cytochrome b subunit
VLSTFAQVNPVWLYGPYTPLAISSASQPDWYMGILEGSLRIMPSWEINFLGHTLSLSVLIPFALPLGIIFVGAALWPFFEQWATGDKGWHNINDRPRNAPVRTGVGVAAVAFYGVLWAEGANDVLADKFDVPLYTITWIARVAVFVVPIGAYFVTKRICLALQRKDAGVVAHGYESGIVRQMPSGEFVEVHTPASEEELAVLTSKHVPAALPAGGEPDANGVPAPTSRGLKGWARGVANRAFLESAEAGGYGHGNGHEHGNGHGEVGGGSHGELGSGEHAGVGSDSGPGSGSGDGGHH